MRDAWREFGLGWNEAASRGRWGLRWVLPLVLSSVILATLLRRKVPSEDVIIIVTSSMQLIFGWCCGYQVGRRRR